MPTQQELNDILRRNLLIEQAVNTTQAMRGRAGLPLDGPINPEELRAMVAKSQFNQRMGVDPQSSRWRKMLANPAQAPADQFADTPEDVARKSRMGGMTYIGGMKYTNGQVPAGFMADKLGEERAKYRPGSDAMQARARRQLLGAAAADASRAKSAELAFRRGALNPAAEASFAQQGVIPDRQAQAVAQRIALAQAMQHPANVDPMKAVMARWLSNPANMDAFMKSRMGGGEESPAAGSGAPVEAPGVYQVPGGTKTVLPGGGKITRRKQSTAQAAWQAWSDYVNSANAMSGPARGF